jgi:hypothetical protein
MGVLISNGLKICALEARAQVCAEATGNRTNRRRVPYAPAAAGTTGAIARRAVTAHAKQNQLECRGARQMGAAQHPGTISGFGSYGVAHLLRPGAKVRLLMPAAPCGAIA